jgi:hypothetical protein
MRGRRSEDPKKGEEGRKILGEKDYRLGFKKSPSRHLSWLAGALIFRGKA